MRRYGDPLRLGSAFINKGNDRVRRVPLNIALQLRLFFVSEPSRTAVRLPRAGSTKPHTGSERVFRSRQALNGVDSPHHLFD